MNRSTGITICAITAFIGSAIAVVFGTQFVRLLMDARLRHVRLPFVPESLVFDTFLPIFVGAWGAASAFGLLNRREWARVSILILGSLCIVFSFLPMLSFLLAPMPRIQGTPRHFNLMVRAGGASLNGLIVGVGAWWVSFFSRRGVKDEFMGHSRTADSTEVPDAPTFQRPVSLTIVAWLLLVTPLLFASIFSKLFPVFVNGHAVFGWQAQLVRATYAIVQVTVAVGLLELKSWSRALALCYFSFLVITSVAPVIVPNWRFGLVFLRSSSAASIFAVLLLALAISIVAKNRQAFSNSYP